MNNPYIVINMLLYTICSIVAGAKQYHAPGDRANKEIGAIFAVMLGPAWLIGAIIRQTFIETWK